MEPLSAGKTLAWACFTLAWGVRLDFGPPSTRMPCCHPIAWGVYLVFGVVLLEIPEHAISFSFFCHEKSICGTRGFLGKGLVSFKSVMSNG